MQTVDALNGERTVFQGAEDGCVLVREADLEEPDPENDDAIEDCGTEPEDEDPGLSEAVLYDDVSAGSPHDEEAGDFAEIFSLPKITGEEDKEMVESELFQPETVVAHVDGAPTLEDIKANEGGILDFLARMYEYKTVTPR